MEGQYYPPRFLRRPGDNGYRTPTIEDVEKASSGHPLPETVFDNELSQVPTVLSRYRGSVSHANGGPNHNHEDDAEDRAATSQNQSVPEMLPWRKRIRHITWAYFALTMATGGLANTLYKVPYRFHGLYAIGVTIFILNMVLYTVIWLLLLFRFYSYPRTFKQSFLHPTESLFVPASIVSLGTILINISQYGPAHTGEWLSKTIVVLFWFYVALAVASSTSIYLVLWSTQTFTIAEMTPIWIFPAYPMLITGPYAGTLSTELSPPNAWSIIIGGATVQGVGFLVSMMVYSAYIYRLMTQKLPKENVRPGMFVSVGPSGFTVAGLIGMAASAERVVPPDFLGDGPLCAKIITVLAYFASLWIWGLAIFFFFVSVFAHTSTVGSSKMAFSMTWFSFVFPNTAFATAMFAIGKAFSSHAINIVGVVVTIMLFITYFFVVFMMIRAIRLRQILWPQKGEDRDEGGFKASNSHHLND